MHRWFCGLFLFLTSCAAAFAQPMTIPQLDERPVLDGIDNDAAWAKAASLALPYRLGGGEAQARTAVKVYFTNRAIFLLFAAEEALPERMQARMRRRDGQVWLDDCVEAFFAPDRAEPGCYYHVVVNSLGAIRDEYWSDGKSDASWNTGAIAAARREGTRWVVETSIPFTAFNRAPVLKDDWAANFARSRLPVPEPSSWQPLASGFHEPEKFGAVVFPWVSSLPVVRELASYTTFIQAEKLLQAVLPLRRQLPAASRSPLWQQAAGRISRWEDLLESEVPPARTWLNIRQVQKERLEWNSLVRRARAEDKRQAITRNLGQPYTVFVLSPMTKLRPEEIPDIAPVRPVRLYAARGEAESAQLLVSALSRPLRNVSVRCSLTGPGGGTLPLEIHRVGYVPVKQPTPGGFGIAGRYPDPLLPFRPFDAPRGEPRAVWLTAWVPRTAAPGEYRGTIAVVPAGQKAVLVPFSVKVYKTVLPARSALKTAVLIRNTGGAPALYGKRWTPERLKRFYETGLRYRFTAPPPLPWDNLFSRQPDGQWKADWADFDRQVREWIAKGATAFSIGGILHWGVNLPPEADREETEAKLRLLGRHLKERGWSDRFYCYAFDVLPAADLKPIQAICAYIHRQAPNLNVLLTGYNPAFRALAGYIGIWVPHINQYDPAFMRARQARGDQAWMYVCIGTANTSYPDMWRIDWTGTAHRAVGWWLWRYNCEGFLYWCVDYWLDSKGRPFDLFRNPTAYPGGNGDGFLFYPDPARRSDPIPTVRLEIQRDGFEDYDLLVLLKQAVRRSRTARGEQWLDARHIITAPDRFSHNPAAYEARHRAVLEALESAR
ncbi:MAG: DUF4091 domain-containing protein [Armatimonadetes bacterium]|nr:DUF4091 domain-containing protein [Armatimonadota bacterium]